MHIYKYICKYKIYYNLNKITKYTYMSLKINMNLTRKKRNMYT